jgi:hypothetical protein
MNVMTTAIIAVAIEEIAETPNVSMALFARALTLESSTALPLAGGTHRALSGH